MTQEENEKVEISLNNLGTINKNLVTIKKGVKEINLYFSYKTLVGINQYCIKNYWGNTTGKLLNEIEKDKSKRMDKEEFNIKASELLKVVLK